MFKKLVKSFFLFFYFFFDELSIIYMIKLNKWTKLKTGDLFGSILKKGKKKSSNDSPQSNLSEYLE